MDTLRKQILPAIGLLVVLALFACDNKVKPETKTISTPQENYRDKVYCELKQDTFSFKGFKIGMSIDEAKNIRKIKFKNTSRAISAPEIRKPAFDPTDKVEGVESYEVTNSSSYRIFENKIDRICIRFYKGKMFEILIELKTSIVQDLASKLKTSCGVSKAVQLKDRLDNPTKKATGEWLDLSNKFLSLICASDDKSCELNVQDVKIRALLESKVEEAEKKKEVKKLNDF